MQLNPYLVLGLLVFLMAAAGFLVIILTKSVQMQFEAKTRDMCLAAMFFIMLIGVLLIFSGVQQKNAPTKSVSAELSRNALIVQRLLRGEDVPLADYTTIPALIYVAERELRLPPETVKIIADHRRYTLRLNTNDSPAAVNTEVVPKSER